MQAQMQCHFVVDEANFQSTKRRANDLTSRVFCINTMLHVGHVRVNHIHGSNHWNYYANWPKSIKLIHGQGTKVPICGNQ